MLHQFLLHREVNQLHIYIYPPLLDLPPSHSSRSSQSTGLSSLYQTAASHQLFYIRQCMHVNPDLSICPTLPFHSCVHMQVPYGFISIPALKIGSSVPFFQIPYICLNIRYLFSLSVSRFSQLKLSSNFKYLLFSRISPLQNTIFYHQYDLKLHKRSIYESLAPLSPNQHHSQTIYF